MRACVRAWEGFGFCEYLFATSDIAVEGGGVEYTTSRHTSHLIHSVSHLQRPTFQEDPNWGKFLVTSIVAVQRQLIQHRLPRDYDYHRIPAPWIQIKLLKVGRVRGGNGQVGFLNFG